MTALIVALILIAMLLCFMAYLLTTQRSESQRMTEILTTQLTQREDSTEQMLRLVITSSTSQSADMTDLLDKTTKKWADLLELMSLGREQQTQPFSEIELNDQEKQLLREPSDSEMPLHIQEALAREREAEQALANRASMMPSQPLSNRQGFSSEMSPEVEVEITPL